MIKVLHVDVGGTDKEINAGDYGESPPDESYLIIGHKSFGISTDDVYYERGISLLHGFLIEYYIDELEYIVKARRF